MRNVTTGHPAPRTPHPAFTLVELLVVMGIIGLIVASSVPGLSGYARGVKLKAATREVVGLISLARHMAISSRKAKTVVVNPQLREVLIEETLNQGEPRRMRLPATVDVAVQLQGQPDPSEGISRLVFQPSGAMAGRSLSVVISDGSRSQSIAVTATTGTISVQ